MVKDVSGVILAGGANKRFGGIIKATVMVGGKTIITRMTDLLDNIFKEIIIVTNTPDEFREFKKCRIIKDIIVKAGPLGGIYAAIENSSNNSVFVFAADMPFLNERVIMDQISRNTTGKFDAVVPQIGNNIEPLHAIYNTSVRGTLMNLLDSRENLSVRNFLEELNVNYMNFQASEENRLAFTNINSPDDLLQIENKI